MYSRFMHFRPEGGNVGGAAAAPAAPAGAAPLAGEGGAIVITPNTFADTRSAVEKASDAARAAIADHGSALPVPGAAKPRAADGTFAPAPDPTKTPEQIAADAAAKIAADATKTPEELAAEQAGKTPEEIEAERVAAEQAGEVPDAERVVEFTIGDETLPVEFDDPAVAASVRELVQIADRADAIVERAEAQIAEVMMVRDAVQVDPVGFVLGELGTDHAAIEHLVLSLVTQNTPEAATLRATLAKLAADPNELRLTASEQRAARSEFREQAAHRVAEQTTVRQNYRDVEAVVQAILPPDATPEIAAVARQDMLMDLKAYAERHKLMTIPPEDIPMILARRLTALRVDPVAAAKLANEAINRPPSRASARGVAPNRVKSARTNVEPAKPVAAPKQKTGSAFVQSAERRKAVAIPGSGHGAPGGGSTLTPPRNADGSKMTVEQTVAWHRDRLAKGVKSYQPAG